MKQPLLLALFLLSGLSPIAIQAKKPPLFASDKLLELTLTTNMAYLLSDRGANPESHSALISWKNDQGDPMSLAIELEARGRFRRDPLICDLPPLKLDIPKKKADGTLFEDQNHLKLVTRCKEEATVVREYYIYKLFSLLSEKSFRVRLAKITYVDSRGKNDPETSFAFFIEDDDDLAKRLDADVDDDSDLGNEDMERETQTLVHVFNYMVANRDFDVRLRQNVKIMVPENGQSPYAVPYDFDWAGVVDASYTNTGVLETTLYEQRQRYKPICRTEEEVVAVLELLESKKALIWNLYETSPWLSAGDKAYALACYSSFFKQVKSKKFVRKTFVDSCPDNK